MGSLFNDVCVLVTAAFVLTFVPGLRLRERSLLSMRDRGTALLVFLVLGLVEEASDSRSGWLNERIVTVCGAGLVAGPWVGLAVSAFVTWLAVGHDGLPLGSIGISMLCGGLAGGWLYRWRPKLAQHPLTGFCLTLTVSWLRNGLTLLCAPGARAGVEMFGQMGIAPVLQGLGTALILTIVAHVRDRDEQSRAAASAEVRALQARMNPHFLFNAIKRVSGACDGCTARDPPCGGTVAPFSARQFRPA
jgi:two-component system LytT family sensor kinase